MAPVPDGASELPRSKPKTASPKRFAWRLYPFTTTSPTWATITVLNAPATVPSKPPRTPLINSPASFIISLKLGSLMMKLFLQSLKLVTKNTVCTSYKLSLGKWVTHSCRPMRDPQFLERGTPQRSFFAGGLPGCTTLGSIVKSPVVSPLPAVPPLTLVGAAFSSASAAEEAAPD